MDKRKRQQERIKAIMICLGLFAVMVLTNLIMMNL